MEQSGLLDQIRTLEALILETAQQAIVQHEWAVVAELSRAQASVYLAGLRTIDHQIQISTQIMKG